MTAAVCKQDNLHVLGWIFNDHYLNYEEEIVQWSGFPKIASIPATKKIELAFINAQASIMKNALINFL
jgi:dethiobiotin synthetase